MTVTTTSPARTLPAARRPRSSAADWLRRPRAPLNPPRWLALLVGVTAAVGLVLVPLANPSYINLTVTLVMIWTIVGLGLNLLVGFGGQVSLGHSAFFALGAYAVAVGGEAGIPHPVTLVVAGVLPFVVGYLIGLPALRLETGVRQPAALRLYERAGYARRGPFGGYPDDPLSVFMEKLLGG